MSLPVHGGADAAPAPASQNAPIAETVPAPTVPPGQTAPVVTAAVPAIGSSSSNIFGGYTSDPDALRNLIVNYLPPLMNEAQVYELFGQFGKIESVKIIYDKITGESRGYGFVKYQFFFSATYAVSCLNRFEIGGKKLKVAYANAPAAKDAYEMLRLSTMALNMQQQQAMQSMYYNQMVLSREEGASAAAAAAAAAAGSGSMSAAMGGGGGYNPYMNGGSSGYAMGQRGGGGGGGGYGQSMPHGVYHGMPHGMHQAMPGTAPYRAGSSMGGSRSVTPSIAPIGF
ncbi:RNA-binding protein [Novymonas esmeraldas]|uniref:RNA-binding protein n=1 Tax=Novymonas esmeraldas TaxID=1808958 RepID=A0AAW0F535_9TRYP